MTSLYIRWPLPGGGSDGISIGGDVTDGDENAVLFVSPAGILAQDVAHFSYTASTHLLAVTNFAISSLTASRAVATDADKNLVSSTATATQLGYLASATGALASTTATGLLSTTDWNTFNNKQATLTLGNLTSGTTGLTIGSGTGAVVGSGTTVSVQTASTSQPGLLSSTDWNTFNGKQASGNYITALTGDVTAAGPGSVASTIAAGAVDNGKVSASAAIAYSKLALGLSIVNADISTTAAIAANKLAPAANNNRVLTSSSSGFLSSASLTTDTEIGYVHGVTSAIQTQLDAKGSGTVTSVELSVPATSLFGVSGSPVTSSGTLALTTTGTSGGIPYFSSTSALSSSALLTANAIVLGGGAATAPATLGSLGTTTTVLHGNAAGAPTFGAIVNADITNATIDLTTKVTGALPIANGGTGQATKAPAFDALSPMTTGGDLIYGGASGTGTRLANGNAGDYLKSAGTTAAPTWGTFTAPTIQKFTSTGSTTGYMFTITAGNATVGATYTNNSQTFTVLGTIASGTQLFTSSGGAPAGSGTLTKATGTGDSTLTFSTSVALGTYTTAANVKWIKVRMVGAGGGGGGTGTSTNTSGGAGASTFFGAGLLKCTGGGGGITNGGTGGLGGTPTLASPGYGTAIAGGSGGGGVGSITSAGVMGGVAGQSAFGGGGGFTGAGTGIDAATNSGSGGAGGVSASGGNGAGGGGAGAYIDAFLASPSATYPYAVGTAGSFGAAGTGGTAGGLGGSGYIEVTEYYQ